MPIPNAQAAYISRHKLIDYLLNEQHSVGGSKAKWLRTMGYDFSSPEVLERDLLSHLQTSDVYDELPSSFGIKYLVEGRLITPSGRDPLLTTVWIVEPSDSRPRLVTAYPGGKS